MSTIASTSLNNRSSLFRSIVIGGLIIGMLHMIIQQVIFFYFIYKNPFLGIFQYIASGLLGNAAFEGRLATALLGVLHNLIICLIIAGVFILSANRILLLRRYVIVGSLLFGLGVFIVMNFIVLPLSAAPPLPVPTMPQIVESIIEHILPIGLPLGIFVQRNVNANK